MTGRLRAFRLRAGVSTGAQDGTAAVSAAARVIAVRCLVFILGVLRVEQSL